jgi:hypothetical protein
LEGAFEAANHLLESLEVNFRGVCLSRVKDAQGCGDVGARTNGFILEAAQEDGVDVLRHASEGWRVDARKAGNEAGMHKTLVHCVMTFMSACNTSFVDLLMFPFVAFWGM